MFNPNQSPRPLKFSGGSNAKIEKHCFHLSIYRWLEKAMKVYVTKLINMI